MNDPIERQRVSDLFDAWEAAELDHHIPKILRDRLKAIPPAQPEIIYCKDCKYREREGKPIADGRYWCELHNTFMYYCSEAERRTDE